MDRGFTEFDFGGIGDFDDEAVVFDVGDGAVDAACGEDIVACCEGLDHFGVLFLFFTLGGDEEEPHGGHEEWEEDVVSED